MAVGDKLGKSVRRNGGEDGNCGSSNVRIRKVEVGADTGAYSFPEIVSEAGGADEVEGELLADGGGWGSDDLIHGGLGNGRYVAPGGRLL